MIYLNNFVCISSIGTTVDEHIKSISTNTNHFSATSKLLPQGMEAFFGIIHEELPEISEKYYGNVDSKRTCTRALPRYAI